MLKFDLMLIGVHLTKECFDDLITMFEDQIKDTECHACKQFLEDILDKLNYFSEEIK